MKGPIPALLLEQRLWLSKAENMGPQLLRNLEVGLEELAGPGNSSSMLVVLHKLPAVPMPPSGPHLGTVVSETKRPV